MKYRKDFVTNSSSSSYVCDICGEEETGWDFPENMRECENGHLFCEDHLLEGENDDFDICEVPESRCPICQFVDFSEHDMAKYLEIKYHISREEAFAEIKKVNRRRRKLYDSEYIEYVCRVMILDTTRILESWRRDFGTYEKFESFLKNTANTY